MRTWQTWIFPNNKRRLRTKNAPPQIVRTAQKRACEAGMDVRDIRDPLGVGTVSVEIPVEQILVLVDLLTHPDPLFPIVPIDPVLYLRLFQSQIVCYFLPRFPSFPHRYHFRFKRFYLCVFPFLHSKTPCVVCFPTQRAFCLLSVFTGAVQNRRRRLRYAPLPLWARLDF